MVTSEPRDSWATSVVLGDGEAAFIRPMTRADAPLLLAFHERQPRENLYRRFFSSKPTLTERELEHFTDIDFAGRVALVLELRGEFIAWASYERWPDREDAEVAFMVDDAHQGKGIATLLLEHLAAIARANGIDRFTAEVLSDNRSMLRVFSRAGWPIERHYDSGITELEWPLLDTDRFLDSVTAREQRADSRAIARLLLPRSVAVIGASDRRGSVGHELWRNLTRSFDGPVYAVNARHAEVGGVAAVASVTDIVEDVWLAIIAVPSSELVSVVDQCIAKRVRGAVIVTSVPAGDPAGPEQGLDLPALVAHARRNGMRIIGPTSMGIASLRPGGVQAALVHVDLPQGGVAISLQSGSLGASVLQLASQMSIGLSWFVSLGDKADVSGNDLLQFWEDDEATRVIAIYTETFGNPRKFARLARRVGRTRPIVAVRTGAAAMGSAGDALYAQAGLIEVPTVRAMLDTARVFATQPTPAGSTVAILTNARSPGVLARAALETAGLTVVDPPAVLDWRSSEDDLHAALQAAIADPAIDAVMVIHAPPLATADAPLEAIDTAAAESAKPVVAVMLGRDDGPLLPGSRVPAFSFPEPAAVVLGRMAAYSRWLATEAHDAVEPIDGIDADAVHAVLAAAMTAGRSALEADEIALVLTAYGLTAPASVLTRDAAEDDVVLAASTLGHPVAIKATRRRVGRSAMAGVALDLADDDAVRGAVRVIRASLGDDARDLVVQRMVPPGVDVRISCATDARLGPVMTVGLGSMQVALPGDISRLAPLSAAGAAALVRNSHVGPALTAARIDHAVLVDAIRRVSQLASEHHEIDAIEIDPALVGTAGCQFTDVQIRITAREHRDLALRSLT